MSFVSALRDAWNRFNSDNQQKQARDILFDFYNAEFGTPKHQKALDDIIALDPKCGFMDLTKISARTEWIRRNFDMYVEDRKSALNEQPDFYKNLIKTKEPRGIAYQVLQDCMNVLWEENLCRRLPFGRDKSTQKVIEMGRLKDPSQPGARLSAPSP